MLMKRTCFFHGKVVIRGELEPSDTYKYSTPGYHAIDFFDHIPFCEISIKEGTYAFVILILINLGLSSFNWILYLKYIYRY